MPSDLSFFSSTAPQPAIIPQAVVDLAPSVQIRYIGSVRAGEPIQLTANMSITATNHYSDPEVAPGQLDIVLIPGPDPFVPVKPGMVEWLRAQGAVPGTDILSVCTGIFVCGDAGLLKGREVCGPRGLQDMIRARGYGEKALVGDKYRWTQDGNLWSSGLLCPFFGTRSPPPLDEEHHMANIVSPHPPVQAA